MSEIEAKTSHIGGLIPQVFYDLIGRIVPGAFLLFIGLLLIHGEDWKQNIGGLFGKPKIPYSLFVTLGLLFSYMTGILLGGIGYFVERIVRRRKENVVILDRDGILPAKKPNIKSVSYIYDVIQHYDPAAGARLAKLSGERNMCRVLIVGSVLLEIWHVLKDKVFFDYWLVFFVVCILSSYLFYSRLISRSRALMQNYRDIFERENKPGICDKRCNELNENDLNGLAKNENTTCYKKDGHINDKREKAK